MILIISLIYFFNHILNFRFFPKKLYQISWVCLIDWKIRYIQGVNVKMFPLQALKAQGECGCKSHIFSAKGTINSKR